MWARRFNRASVVVAALTLVGLVGMVVLLHGGADRQLADVTSLLDPGDRTRVSGEVQAVVPAGAGAYALELTDASTTRRPLLVLTGDPAAARAEGTQVSVRGTVETFDVEILAGTYRVDVGADRLHAFSGQTIVVADSLRRQVGP